MFRTLHSLFSHHYNWTEVKCYSLKAEVPNRNIYFYDPINPKLFSLSSTHHIMYWNVIQQYLHSNAFQEQNIKCCNTAIWMRVTTHRVTAQRNSTSPTTAKLLQKKKKAIISGLFTWLKSSKHRLFVIKGLSLKWTCAVVFLSQLTCEGNTLKKGWHNPVQHVWLWLTPAAILLQGANRKAQCVAEQKTRWTV